MGERVTRVLFGTPYDPQAKSSKQVKWGNIIDDAHEERHTYIESSYECTPHVIGIPVVQLYGHGVVLRREGLTMLHSGEVIQLPIASWCRFREWAVQAGYPDPGLGELMFVEHNG